ncbi:MAG: short-chain dehydrogenase [Linnemannia elongata]|nr:MAG: short-chain dehydrogenase [Linnemannia elongata]
MTNPTLIITGASRGIGRSIALLAIQNLNANVIGVARSQAALQELSSHIETDLKLMDRFKFVVGDVTAESTAVEVVDVASKSWSGRLDGLVLNAGILEPLAPIAKTNVKDWKHNFDVNFILNHYPRPARPPCPPRVYGPCNLWSALAPLSMLTMAGVAYCASKAALKMFGESLAKEEPEVTSVSIRPGVVDTEMQAVIRREGVTGMVPSQHAQFVDLHTSKKLLHPDQPGHVIASLAVKAPSSISGKFFSWNDEELVAHQLP